MFSFPNIQISVIQTTACIRNELSGGRVFISGTLSDLTLYCDNLEQPEPLIANGPCRRYACQSCKGAANGNISP